MLGAAATSRCTAAALQVWCVFVPHQAFLAASTAPPPEHWLSWLGALQSDGCTLKAAGGQLALRAHPSCARFLQPTVLPLRSPSPPAACSYRLTGGSKFGADYLVYPGDPSLYHAQFCVRLLPYEQPILPAMLASATRGSHQARKHLLIASVVEEGRTVASACQEAANASMAGAPAAAAAAADALVGGDSAAAQATSQGDAAAQAGQPAGSQAGAAGREGDAAAVAAVQQQGQAGTEQQEQQPLQQQQQQQQQQQHGPEANGVAEQPQPPPGNTAPAGGIIGSSSTRLGGSSTGTGSRGQRYRIHYMTIGPVEGFG